jgi:hypothetical protein
MGGQVRLTGGGVYLNCSGGLGGGLGGGGGPRRVRAIGRERPCRIVRFWWVFPPDAMLARRGVGRLAHRGVSFSNFPWAPRWPSSSSQIAPSGPSSGSRMRVPIGH